MSDAEPMSETAPPDQPTVTGADFTSTTCGWPGGGSAQGTSPLLPEGGWLAINGSTDLSSCVVGPDSASISKAFITNQPPMPDGYAYAVWVYGQGPSGAGSGWFELTFTDQSSSDYSVKLYSSSPGWHYVEYNSQSPGITQMSWNPWSVPAES